MKLNQYIAVLPLLLLLSGCKDKGPQNTLSGNGEKTPLRASALLDAGGADVTRAAGKEFDATSGDQLVAYLRHVKWNGGTSARELVTVQNSPMLATFTATGNTAYTGDDIKPIGLGGTIVVATKTNEATNQATTLTADPALYWDDFSANDANDGREDSKNIRDEKHYLQSYYGYCFNGGEGTDNAKGATVKDHITTALTEATGVLGWKVSADQREATNFKQSDLLWSAEQTPVAYAHAEAPSNNHGTLLLPYTHAMSKVTIHVTVRNGFASDYSLAAATGTLHDQFVSCTCTAPTNQISVHTGNQNIQMKRTVPAENKKVTFEAIIVPSILSVGNNFATISTGGTDADNYQIPVTQNMITSWKQTIGALRDTTERIINGVAQAPGRADEHPTIPVGKGYAMVSGVNYVLNVTIDKQDVTVSATIRDWVDVEAEGTAIVQFAGDVTEKGTIQEELKEKGLDVYKSNSDTEFTTKSTSLTWSTYANQWIYDPAIYWAGQGDASYFRALSPKGTTTSLTQGNDILWGTSGDEAIAPRTGDVPLEFEHAMTKISIQLETSEVDAAKVDFDGATLSLSHLATKGTIAITTGDITPLATVEEAYTKQHTATSSPIYTLTIVNGECFIPQTIGNASRLKLTLKDGTTYSLQLNTCVDSNSTAYPQPPITTWHRGRHYTYTIHVEKEAITFRAMIKNWAETSGGGNATLEWD